ncbi:nicotinamide N-methyltransferase-like [Dendronephthya gigantea]|uniref:nicotinamide N-methyltransferase-like n=1 Tax=Dendronephthya gigantea TaxID=151771 RepID=UPI00106D4AF2|nr:nicotinamide N-methyltransferase-like [Dendronephthya gigantea]
MADYLTAFDINAYLVLESGIFDLTSDDKSLLEFRMKTFHKFWSNFKPESSKESSNIRCLEFGGGPVVRNLISASPKVDRIVFSEYLECNRRNVLSWLAGDTELRNWSPLIKYVVHDLEGDNNPEAVSEREKDMKQKIQSVVSCDVNQNPIVDLESIDVGKPFDVLSTSLCVEVVASSEQHYKSTVAKLCKFLKPNGYLIMFGIVNETFYTVGDARFYHFGVTQRMIEEALKDAGIEDLKMELLHRAVKSTISDGQAFFSVVGKKSDKG